MLDEIVVLGSRCVTRGELERAIEPVRLGLVKPAVDRVRPLAELNEAYDDLERGRIVGRTVLQVAAGLSRDRVGAAGCRMPRRMGKLDACVCGFS